jgi:hypothetical protein
MDTRAGWVGSIDDCANALQPLFADGVIIYNRSPSDPADEDAIQGMNLRLLFQVVPKGNARWSTLVKAILKLMSGCLFGNPPKDLKKQLKVAECQATVVRTICFHIRREWYRRSKKQWMLQFERPDNFDGIAAGPVAAAGAAPLVAAAAAASSSSCSAVPVSADGAAPLVAAAAAMQACGNRTIAIHGCDWTEMEFMEALWIADDPDEVWFGVDEFELDDETIWHYGFDTFPDKSRSAWRRLASESGEEIIPKELASHCTEPVGGIGLMIGHFLDGTCSEIPGMLCGQICKLDEKRGARKRPAANDAGPALKRPAATDGNAEDELGEDELRDDGGEDGGEDGRELGEEELASADECVDPDEQAPEQAVAGVDDGDPLLPPLVAGDPLRPPLGEPISIGDYVWTHNLELDMLNGKCFKVVGKHEETGRWLCALIPEQTPTYKIKGDKLTVLTEKQAMKFYKETCEINAVVYNIKGTSQGTRNALIIVTGGGQQLGSVQVQPGHAATAFVLTKAVMADLKNDFDRNGIQPSRSVFFERRDVYLSAD